MPPAAADRRVDNAAQPLPCAIINPFEMAREQLASVAERIDLRPDVHAMLRHPKRELTVNFPVSMDDGSVKMVTGYRVHHNLTRGPAKGGIRYPL